MRGFLAELWDKIEDDRCDAVEALCKPYPSQVIATVMGASLDDAGRLWDWSNLIQRQFGMSVLEERAQIEQAVTEFYEYAGDLLNRRREDPGEDLISTLIAAEDERSGDGSAEAGDRLSDVELVNLVLNVLVGGVDTTQSQLAHALRLFADHPDQWERLATEPELAPKAVDEVLRFEPITPFTARIAMEDVVYRDVTFPEGTVVLVCAFTGNRDGEPDAFDITAERKAKPLTFGAGVHYCLGANLARAELQEALTFLAPRTPGLALDGEPEYGTIDGIYGLDALPVRWSPPSRCAPARCSRGTRARCASACGAGSRSRRGRSRSASSSRAPTRSCRAATTRSSAARRPRRRPRARARRGGRAGRPRAAGPRRARRRPPRRRRRRRSR